MTAALRGEPRTNDFLRRTPLYTSAVSMKLRRARGTHQGSRGLWLGRAARNGEVHRTQSYRRYGQACAAKRAVVGEARRHVSFSREAPVSLSELSKYLLVLDSVVI